MTDKVHNVRHDGFDRARFEEIVASTPQLAEPRARLERLLPHVDALLMDLFAAVYKLNVVLEREDEVKASVLLNRRVVKSLFDDPRFHQLRQRTELDLASSRQALVILARRVLDGLRTGDRLVASELAQGMEAADAESALDDLEAMKRRLEELGDEHGSTWEKVASELDADTRAAQQKIADLRKSQKKTAHDLPVAFDHDVSGAVEDLNDNLSDVQEALSAYGIGGGGRGATDPDLRLDLGQRLMKSKKLRLLARLLGAMKEVAFEARKQRIARAPQITHAVKTGNDLSHLLPAELLGLSPTRPGLHRDFLRRFEESQLLQYELEAPADRGPLVVCVDGSASMQGTKEIWAKAVSLTLVELARRQKRRCLGIIFSSGPDVFEVELTARSGSSDRPRTARGSSRSALAAEEVLRFAEHFPAGGTSFEEPLERALHHVTRGRYRRGDIAFVTDGEASVSPDLVERVHTARKERRFMIRTIVIDAGAHRTSAVEQFSDDVRRVSDLTSDSLADVFAQFG